MVLFRKIVIKKSPEVHEDEAKPTRFQQETAAVDFFAHQVKQQEQPNQQQLSCAKIFGIGAGQIGCFMPGCDNNVVMG